MNEHRAVHQFDYVTASQNNFKELRMFKSYSYKSFICKLCGVISLNPYCLRPLKVYGEIYRL